MFNQVRLRSFGEPLIHRKHSIAFVPYALNNINERGPSGQTKGDEAIHLSDAIADLEDSNEKADRAYRNYYVHRGFESFRVQSTPNPYPKGQGHCD